MKTAIVYYSMSSNTSYVAKRIAKIIKADLVFLEPVNAFPDKGFKKFFWGGKSALMKERPELNPYEFDPDKYDIVIFGTPVWASCYTPPLRTFIEDYKDKLRGKKIGAFACYSGIGVKKALEKLRIDLDIPSFDVTMELIDPKEKNTEEKNRQIDEFCQKILEL